MLKWVYKRRVNVLDYKQGETAMNQSFYESRANEKLSKLRNEGTTSQDYFRSRASKANMLSKLPKLAIVVLIIWGLAQLFIQ